MTNCHQLKMRAADGKNRLTDVADTEQLLRIIQSIPSKNAEPFKAWLALVGRERIEETIDPERAIDRALETYLKKGYSEAVSYTHLRAHERLFRGMGTSAAACHPHSQRADGRVEKARRAEGQRIRDSDGRDHPRMDWHEHAAV